MMAGGREVGLPKPVREVHLAIHHALSTKHTECEQFFGRELKDEIQGLNGVLVVQSRYSDSRAVSCHCDHNFASLAD